MKKLFSFLMGILLIFSTYFNVFADKELNFTKGDRDKIRSMLEREAEDGTKEICIKFQKSYSSNDDYREIKIYNIPWLCNRITDKDCCNSLRGMLELYFEAKKDANVLYSKLTSSGSEYTASDAEKVKIIDSARKNSSGRAAINDMAKATGLSEKDVEDCYVMLVLSEILSKFSLSTGEWTSLLGGATVAGLSVMAIVGAVCSYLGKSIFGLSALTGPMAIGLCAACLVGLLGVSLIHISHCATSADLKFKTDRAINIAKAIKSFGDKLTKESEDPNSVLDANVFVYAVDFREDSSGNKFEDKNMFWKWWNSNLRNDGAICKFMKIPGIDDIAPKASDYRAKNGISLSDYMNFFRSISNGDKLDYKRLEKFKKDPITTLKASRPQESVVSRVSARLERNEDSDSE